VLVAGISFVCSEIASIKGRLPVRKLLVAGGECGCLYLDNQLSLSIYLTLMKDRGTFVSVPSWPVLLLAWRTGFLFVAVCMITSGTGGLRGARLQILRSHPDPPRGGSAPRLGTMEADARAYSPLGVSVRSNGFCM